MAAVAVGPGKASGVVMTIAAELAAGVGRAHLGEGRAAVDIAVALFAVAVGGTGGAVVPDPGEARIVEIRLLTERPGADILAQDIVVGGDRIIGVAAVADQAADRALVHGTVNGVVVTGLAESRVALGGLQGGRPGGLQTIENQQVPSYNFV